MKYIVYRLNDLQAMNIFSTQLPEQHPGFYHKYGIAEYNGEIPQNDWLTVSNVREEIETWKEKEINELGEEVEVEYSKTHIVCDLVAHFYPKRELTEEQKAKQKQAKYENLVEKYIREKYSLSNELAILRQASVKVEEFNEYNAYAEACKERAKGEIYG